MDKRIIRGVRVATATGIMPASVHIADGRIVAVAGYENVPRESMPLELGKSVLMPGLTATTEAGLSEAELDASMLQLSKQWTAMRSRDEPIQAAIDTFCKGLIEEGSDADFVIWNPEMTVIGTKAPTLYGQVRQVILAGECVFKDGKHL